MTIETDIFALLEDGPNGAGQLAVWLKEPPARVFWALKRMAKKGIVKRVGADQRWALASYIEPNPPAATPAASTVGRVTQKTEVAATAPLARPAAARPTVPPIDEDEGEEFVGAGDFDLASLDEWDDIDTAEPPPPRRPGRKPKLRQDVPAASRTVPKGGAPAWWVGKSREEFQEAARHEFDTRLQFMKLPANLFPQRGI